MTDDVKPCRTCVHTGMPPAPALPPYDLCRLHQQLGEAALLAEIRKAQAR